MTNFHSLRIWIKYRGFILFLLFSFLPYAVSFCIGNLFNDNIRLLTSVSVYGGSILMLLVMQSVRATSYSFFRVKDFTFVYSSFILGVTAYIVAMSVTFAVVSIPSHVWGDNLPAWITASNQGFISFLDGNNVTVKIIWFFIITVLAPITEEIIFRGYLQDFITRIVHCNNVMNYNISSKIIIFGVALIFSLFHFNSLANMIFAFIVGVFLSVIKMKYQNIIASSVAHGLVNCTSLLIGLFLT